jgi:glycerol-3-phosphate acyltransferase PlsY
VSAAQLLGLAAAYLVGSIPFSYLVARRAGVDVRKVGSGNVGATNVMRSAGATAGMVAFLLDACKGAVVALVALRLDPGSALPALAAAFAVLGHMYPVWLGFTGGKGVATGAGAFLPLAPLAAGVALVVFAIALATLRYVSLASLAGAVSLAAVAFLTGSPRPVAWSAAAMAALIVWKHRGNLRRIARGTEKRLGAHTTPREAP